MAIQTTQQSVNKHAEELLETYKHAEKLSLILFVTVIFLLIIILFFVAVAFFPKNIVVQTQLISIATSLVASLALTLLYEGVVDRARGHTESYARSLGIQETREIVSEEIKIATTELSREIQQRINKMLEEEATRLVNTWPELLPKEYFPPSEVSNPYFMGKLGEAVKQAQEYCFRGATARFVPELLVKYAQTDLSCKILIIDPRAEIPLQIYAHNRFVTHESVRPHEEQMEEVRQEIYRAIVNLFDLRQRFRIEIRLCRDNLFYRSEITDESAFVSFYVGNRHTYPPTYFYTRDNGRFYYSAFHKDFQQSWDATVEFFSIRPAMKEDELESFLFKIGAGAKDAIADKIRDWRANRQKEP